MRSDHCNLPLLFRLIRNPLGSTHPEATLKACLEHGAPEDAVQAAKAEFHAQLASKRGQQANGSADLVEDSELLSEDRELDSDNQGTIRYFHNIVKIQGLFIQLVLKFIIC